MKKKQETKELPAAKPVEKPQAMPILTVGDTFRVMLRDGWHPARVLRVDARNEICVMLVDDHREVSFSIQTAVVCRNSQP